MRWAPSTCACCSRRCRRSTSRRGRADHRLSIVSGGAAGRFRIVLDGRFISRVDHSEAAVAHALHHLDELAVDGSAAALLFHAGAVERDGRVVVVLGVSGQGKSTVTAALVQRGFHYLSDEVVAVDVATREVRPYPKALDLQPEALDLLGVDADATSMVLPGSKVKVLPDRLGEVGAGGKPTLLVFLADTARGRVGARVRRGSNRSRPRRRSWRSCP